MTWLQKYGAAGLILVLVLVSKLTWRLARLAFKVWVSWG